MSTTVWILIYLICLPSFSYAPWCPACKQIESTWESFAKESERLDITVGKVDVTQEPGIVWRRFLLEGIIQCEFHLVSASVCCFTGAPVIPSKSKRFLSKKPYPHFVSPCSSYLWAYVHKLNLKD